MKALGPDAEQRVESRGQHVLARVLLHVVEPARPVDHAADRRPVVERRVQDMEETVFVVVDHLRYRNPAERAGIERLAAGCRVERGAIETTAGRPSNARRGDHSRVEFARVGVGVIQALSHQGIDPGAGTLLRPAVNGSCMPASAKPFARRRQLSQTPQGAPSTVGE